MKKKIVVVLSIIFVLLTAVFVAQKVDRAIKLSQIEYREIELNDNNCVFLVNEESQTVEIQEYQGVEDCVIVPETINGYIVENIDTESFSECYNLETIKIPKQVSDNIGEIPDFEKSEKIDDENYVEYKTTREYSEVFEGYLDLSLEEKAEVAIVPNKFAVPLSKLYSPQMEELYGVSSLSVEDTETSYDLRNSITIEVEDQEDYNNCYAYASLSSVETNIALTQNETIDFSEVHAGIMTTGNGGYLLQASDSYYANKIGPVLEADLPKELIYDNTSDENYSIIDKYLKGEEITDEQLAQIQEYAGQKKAAKYVAETITFPSITRSMKFDDTYAEEIETTRATIKEHIKKYGSVAACVAIDNCKTIGDYVTLNDIASSTYNHAVSIVGWDDNFSVENFSGLYRPTNPGAYLVLNSYGEEWGNAGYFWVSYEDQFIETNLCGVVSVEEVAENMESTPMVITDVDTNEIVNAFEIEIGQKLQITTDVTVNTMSAGSEIEVLLRNYEEDVTDDVTISGTQLINNTANLVIDMDTNNLRSGQYVIEISYGEETISKTLKISNDYRYKINSDGTITLTEYRGSETQIVIPSEYEGYSVSKIGDELFKETSITSVVISEGITTIGNNAFEGCKSLNNITFPESLTTIGNNAFNECESLPNITLPEGLKRIGEYAFGGCISFTNIQLPDNIEYLGTFAFQYCTKLETIKLPENITTISTGLFLHCENLKNVKIPEKVASIERGAFQYCYKLEFLKIPRTVTTMGESIFSGCLRLKTVVIFKETTTFKSAMFYDCPNVVIYCEPDSAVIEYAENNYYDYKLLENYTITYDGNGGNSTVANVPEPQTKLQYEDIIITETIPERYGYIFKGWSLKATSITVDYYSGSTFDLNADTTLYAVWDDDPSVEKIDIKEFAFDDATYIYDGTEKTIESLGFDTSLVSVEYTIEPNEGTTLLDGKAVEVGEYTVTATYTIIGDGAYIFRDSINQESVTLTIEKATHDMSGISFENATYTYDKTEKTILISGELPEGVTVSYEENSATNAGTYNAIAKFTVLDTKNYNEIDDMTATLLINKATHDMSRVSFQNATYKYDGKEKSIYVIGYIPEGVTAKYTGNTGTDVGVYNATAEFVLDDPDNYNAIPNMTATLTIEKGSIDMSGISFKDVTYEYDGTEKVLEIEGTLPSEVTVEYENNRLTEIDSVTATAIFTVLDTKNYNDVAPMTAVLTIVKGTYDMSGISFKDATYEYDGTEKVLEISGELPDGVEVSYENNKLTEIDSVTAIANFKVLDTVHYNEIAPMTATLTIKKITYDTSNLKFKSATYVYDGEEKTIVVEGDLPEGVTVSYEENSATNAGTYNAVAKFTIPDPVHYNEIPNMTATLTIDKATHNMDGISFKNATYEYDGTEKVLEIEGTLPEGVTVSYENNTGRDVGTYNAVANFILDDPDNYNAIEPMTATLKITKISGTIKITNSGSFSKTYDGTPVVAPTYDISREGTVRVEYYKGLTTDGTPFTEAPKDAGDYIVKVILEENQNYAEATDEAKFQIKKATYDMSKVSFKNAAYDYDGTLKQIGITGELPTGVTVTYANNQHTEPGSYTATAMFSVADSANYNLIADKKATLTINKLSYDMSGVSFDNKSYDYDGTEKILEITGTLPDGVTVTYENNTGTEVGEYTATANFAIQDSDHYNEIEPMTAILRITAVTGSISITNEDKFTKTYDGTAVVAPTYEATREGNVRIEYYAGSTAEGDILEDVPVDAGTYTVKVVLEPIKNYLETSDTATFEIKKATYNMNGVSFNNATYEYDGKEKEILISGELPNGVTVSYEDNTRKDIGEQTATAKFTIADPVNYNTIADKTAILKITKANYDMSNVSFNNMTVTYDETQKELKITGELPDGVEVTYENNTRTEVGSQTAVAKFTIEDPEHYNEIPDMTATLKIEKITYDMSGVKFQPVTYTYDGTEKVLEIEGTLPEGVTVTYENNRATTVGEYLAIARFAITDTDHYNEIPIKSAVLKIEKATYDMSKVKFEDATYEYDGEEKQILISGDLPENVDVVYENNKGTAVGTYEAVAKFTIPDPINYNEIPNMTALLTIKKATGKIEITNKENLTKVYDGLPIVEPTYTVSREGTVRIEYYEGSKAEGTPFTDKPIKAGTYTVKAVLEETESYAEATETVTFEIKKATYDMSGVKFESATYVYDGTEKEILISGELPAGVESVTYENNTGKEPGIYNAVAKFWVPDTDNYNVIPDMKAVLTIEKITYDMTGVKFEDATYVYDGEEKSIVIEGDLPDGVTVTYEDNTRTKVGSQTATAIFEARDPDHYNEIEPMTATLEITKIPSTITITNKSEYSKTYNGQPVPEPTYTVSRENDVTVTVEFFDAETGELLKEAPTNAGRYVVRVTLAETEIYKGATDQLNFVISKATYNMSGVKFEDATYAYDGTEKEILISGELPKGVTVSYENNTRTKIGEQIATAKFEVEDPVNYNTINDMTATLKITKALSTIEITNADSFTKVYDGEPVPEPTYKTSRENDVTVTTEFFDAETGELLEEAPTNAGKYIVKVTLEETDIYAEATDQVNFEIKKATYDMSGVKFESATYTYDGTEKQILISGELPAGVESVSYENNIGKEPGTYNAVAKFTIEDPVNYNAVLDMKAKLTIEKITYDMSGVKFEDATYVYDGTQKEILISGTLPTDVTVNYENNKGTEVGTYNAVAKFTIPDPAHYNEIDPMTATLKITKAPSTITITNTDSFTKVYDGEPVPEPTYTVSRENDVTVTREFFDAETGELLNEAPTDAGRYIVKVTLAETANYEGATDQVNFEIKKATYDMSKVKFENATYVYDGTEKEILISGDLPDGVTVTYTDNKGTKPGTYNAVASFTIPDTKNYNAIPDMKAVLTIEKITYDMSGVKFEDATYVYDGTEKEIVISGDLPEGVTVSYENNTGTNVGTYNAVAKFTIPYPEYYNEIEPMTATLEITKIPSTIEITNEDSFTKTYDGEPVPEPTYKVSRENDVTVTTEFFDAETGELLKEAPTNAGKYIVRVTLEETDIYAEATAQLNFEIKKANYDMSKVSFNNATYTYDGTEKAVFISGELPEGVEVNYENNTGTEPGTYEAIAKFTIPDTKNYNAIPDMKAKLTIEKITYDMSGVSFEDATYVYDGEQKEIVISGELPQGVTVSYENNTRTEIGSQTATAKFAVNETYYNAIDPMTATLEITKIPSTIEITNKDAYVKTYDGEAVPEPTYEVSRENDVTVTREFFNAETREILNEAPVNAGKYIVRVTLEETEIYAEATDEVKFEIAKATYDMSNVKFEDATYVYDGNEKEILISGTLPTGVTVAYENNKGTEVGTYEAVAKFTIPDETNYNAIPNMTATLKITKAPSTITITNKDSFTKVYDGEPVIEPTYTVSREGTVRVEYYEGSKAEGDILDAVPVEVGTYTVKITLEENENYAEATDTVTFEIQKITYDMSGVKFENATYVYDGTEKQILISGELPQGVTVTYEDNTRTDVGSQKATAIFEVADKAHYNEIPNMTAILEITKKPSTIEITNKDAYVKTYDGEAVPEPTYEVSREDDVTVTTEFFDAETGELLSERPVNAGKYIVRVTLEETEIYEGATDQVNFEIKKATYDMSGVKFEDATYIYDGEEKEILISGTLPTDVTVSYKDNTRTDVGSQTATASFTIPDSINYNEIPDMTAVLKITKAPSTITITNKDSFTKVYDGEQVVEPTYDVSREGTVRVEYYEGSKAEGDVLDAVPAEVGTYTVKVTLEENENYAEATDTAIFEIQKITYDMSGVKFENATYVYDGTEKEILISGTLPQGVTVAYENNKGTDVGTYNAVAKFTISDPDHYNEIPNMTATLEITKKLSTIEITNKDSFTKVYDGEAVPEPTYEVSREDDVTVTTEFFDAETGELLSERPVNAGKYIVRVTLEETEIYEGATDQVNFEIKKETYDMSGVKFEDATYVYDGEEKEILISGTLPTGVTVAYENNKGTEVGTYEAVAKFTIPDETNYNAIPNMTATLKITKAPSTITITNKDSFTKVYDGAPVVEPTYTVSREGAVRIEYYEGSKAEGEVLDAVPAEVGTYTVKVTLEENENYAEATDTATFEIQKITYDMSGVKFENATYVYDGEEKQILISGELPQGVTVTYEDNTRTDIGSQTATAIFKVEDTVHYNEIPNMTAILEITKKPSTITITNKDSFTKVYDGEAVPEPTYEVSRENNVTVTTEFFDAETGELLNEAPVNAGRYIVRVTLEETEIYAAATDQVNFEIKKATYDMSGVKFEDVTYPYDGTEKEVVISGELPEGVTVSYKNNRRTEMGEQTATACFTIEDPDNYNAIQDLTATLKIGKARYDLSGISFKDVTYTYDGTEKKIEITGDLPEGVTVSYENNVQVDAGVYEAKVIFRVADSDLYEEIEPMTAILTINKANYDMSKVKFEDVEYEYDGTEKEIVISGELPDGVEVTYENNKGIVVGTYEAVAKFTIPDTTNYNEIDPMTATLTIKKATGKIEITNEESLTKVYDGEPVVEPTYSASREGTVRIEYYSGSKAEGEILENRPVNAGTYTVKVILEETENFNETSDTATFEIKKASYNMSSVKFENATYVYDGTEKEVVISGELPQGVTVSYENNTRTDVGSQKATAKFEIADTINYNKIANKTALLTIEKITYDMTNIKFEDVTYPYDGTEKSVLISGDLPVGVTVTYENNIGIEAGEYEAIAKFEVADSEHYNEIPNMTAKLTIASATGKITITNKDALSKVYDGKPVVEPTYEKLGTGNVKIEYYSGEEATGEPLKEAPINVGTYTVKVILEETNNYQKATDEATFEISKANYDLSKFAFENVSYEYDGTPKSVKVTGELPKNVEVSYENNTATEVGEYVATAKFTVNDENYNQIEDMTAVLTIMQASGNITITNKDELNKQYDGLPVIEPTYEKTGTGNVIVEYYAGTKAEGEILESAPSNIGTYTVKVILEETQNYTGATDEATFEISKGTSTITITNKDNLDKVYDGKEVIVPTYDVSREGTVRIEYYAGTKAEGEVLGAVPVNAGTYTVKVILEENENYLEATDETTFKISKANYDMSGVKFEDAEYEYDETEKRIEITGVLPYGVTVRYENNTRTEIGTQTATAIFTIQDPLNYNEIEPMTATLSIETKGTIKITNKDSLGKVYDGKIVEKPEYEKFGEGTVKIEYYAGTEVKGEPLDRVPINAGTYTVRIILEGKEITSTDEATFEITKATYDMSMISFEDAEYEYDGTEKSILIKGKLPTGVKIKYENNTGTNAGEYKAKAIFLYNTTNYTEIKPMEATLTITKATLDRNEYSFKDAEYVYDGKEKKIEVGGYLPSDVYVNYENNKATNVGEYNATANFVVDPQNYYPVEPMTATLKITKGIGNIVITNKENLNKVYDGKAVNPTYEKIGEVLPRIEYYLGTEAEGEPLESAPVNVGTYTVKVILDETNNYTSAVDQATFEITKATYDMSGVKFENIAHTYDGTEKVLEIAGQLPEGVTVSYENNTGINAGEYGAKAKFAILDTLNYNVIEDMTAVLKIEKATYDMTNIKFESITYTYDGTEKVLEITGELPEGVTVSYENNTGINAGEYGAKAKFAILDTLNYNVIEDMTAVLKIEKATYDMSRVKFEDITYTYDGTEKVLEITGELPEGVTVSYENNTKVDPGEYGVKAIFTIQDTLNYYEIAPMTAVLTILEPEINFGEYKIVEDNGINYVEYVEENITTGEFKDKILNQNIDIYNKDGNLANDEDIITTGTQIRITIGNKTLVYIIVIKGDITQDGQVNDADLLMLARYLVGCEREQELVVGAALRASDVHEDGQMATDSDLLKLAQILLK